MNARNGLWLTSKCICTSYLNTWFQTRNAFNLMEVCHSSKVKISAFWLAFLSPLVSDNLEPSLYCLYCQAAACPNSVSVNNRPQKANGHRMLGEFVGLDRTWSLSTLLVSQWVVLW